MLLAIMSRWYQTGPKKVARLADVIPAQEVYGPQAGDLLLLSWGGTYGAVRSATRKAQAEGKSVAHAHLRYLNPFPSNLRDILSRYNHVFVPELNTGQLTFLLRGRYAPEHPGISKNSCTAVYHCRD